MAKKIVDIEIIKAGSNPDVDSDIHTEHRDTVVEYITDVYGKDNVANIITFNTLAAKGAFKAMCTIYQVPFAQANKISSLIPGPIEGVDCTIDDLFNPNSSRYSEGAEFRTATSEPYWQKIIEGAKNIEGRNKSTGLHPCGIVISNLPLKDVIPLHVRKEDGRVITQWKYKELEELGLIKMDLLGLDTVDLIQHTVEYIKKSGKTPPNMLKLIHGDMNDKKTFAMLQRGETIGVFQLASPGVQDLLKRMKPTEFNDIVATTALYRPGPMGMLSHIKYADRKNGNEDVDFIHPEFKGTALEEILSKTFGLIVFQEQILKIANQIGGMTLQEGDDLRSAMGKKIVPKMLELKPKFFEGARKNGFSDEAITVLWDTIAEFARYGFNLAHSVAYGMNAYQAAFLKANYPVEFMAALLSQNVDNKDKILVTLKEARRMKLKVGAVDINVSGVHVSPDFKNGGNFDIVYGLSGVDAVSEDMASIIVNEREKNGDFKDVQDVINRCSPLGVSNRRIYQNLARAGAFDCFGVSRRAVVENVPSMIDESKTKVSKGANLFDLFGEEEDNNSSTGIDLTGFDEYPFVDKLQQEASVIGLYLTGHPLDNAGPGLSKMRNITINELLKSKNSVNVSIAGSITDVKKKANKRGGKSIAVTIDDGTGYVTAFLGRDIVKGIDKSTAEEKLESMYRSGENIVPPEIKSIVKDNKIMSIPDIKTNTVYVMDVTYRPGYGDSPPNARVTNIRPLVLTDDGKLPVRIRFDESFQDSNDAQKQKIKANLARTLHNKLPGEYPIFIANHGALEVTGNVNVVYLDAIYKMEQDQKNKVDLIHEHELKTGKKKTSRTIDGTVVEESSKKKSKTVKTDLRSWPPPRQVDLPEREQLTRTETLERLGHVIETLDYVDSGFTTDKNNKVEQAIEKFVGIENYDFGVFNSEVLE